jgi:Fe-S cluster assembly protein SufD
MKETEPYWEKFETFENQARNPAWVLALRKAGMAHFAEQGFPTLHDEDWRFTNVSPIARLPFKPVFNLERDGVSAEKIAGLTFGNLVAIRLVFINGHYVEELSIPGPKTAGLVVKSLAGALQTDSALI